MKIVDTIKVLENGVWTDKEVYFKHYDKPLNSKVICKHSVEITGNTGDEHNLAVEDQQVLIKKIQGQMLVVNQLNNNTQLSSATKNGLTFTNNGNGSVTISGTSTSSVYQLLDYIYLIPNHKYLILSTSTNVKLGVYYSGVVEKWDTGAGTIFAFENSSSLAVNFQTNIPSGTEINETIYPQLIDLTQMFGVGNEPDTYLKYTSLISAKTNLTYNKAEPINSQCNLISIGRNILDEETELGTINVLGQLESSLNSLRSKNYSYILPNKTYYLKSTYSNELRMIFYNENKKFVNYLDVLPNKTFAVPQSARFFKIAFLSGYGTIYNNDVCVKVNDSNYNSIYEPFIKDTFELNANLGHFDYIDEEDKIHKVTSQNIVLNGQSDLGTWDLYRTSSGDPNNKYANVYRFIYNFTNNQNPSFVDVAGRGQGYSTTFEWTQISGFNALTKNSICFTQDNKNQINLLIEKSLIDSIEVDGVSGFTDVKVLYEFLRRNPVAFCFKLATASVNTINIPSGYAVYKNGLQIQDGVVPYILEKEYSLNTKAQILANVEMDREQQTAIDLLQNDVAVIKNKLENGVGGVVSPLTLRVDSETSSVVFDGKQRTNFLFDGDMFKTIDPITGSEEQPTSATLTLNSNILTTAPTSANTTGILKFVVLNVDPLTVNKYAGYLYLFY